MGDAVSGGALESEVDVRRVTEAWDLGFGVKPPEVTDTRFMIIHKAGRAAEGDAAAGNGLAEFAAFRDEVRRAGVLLGGEVLQPSTRGVRLRFWGGSRTITDGPFTESKELIAGFSIMRANSPDEVIAWASRFPALLADIEIDIRRPLYDV